MDKRMALVKFYSIEDSFRAVAALHNEVFSGRKMQISFTKPRN
jgi:RNA recognition motif-containing protein